MDDKRFDLLTKSLSSGISRRSLLRSLAGAVGVAAVGAEVASAAPGGGNGTKKCYGSGSLCTNARQCCSGTCTNRVCAPETVCTPGSLQACYSGPAGTASVGVCKAGSRTCDSTGQWGACAGEVLPSAEICGNGLDDDCDGQVDEGCCSPVDCQYGAWSEWSACSAVCGAGEQTRTRVVAAEASCGGAACDALLLEQQPCNTPDVPIDCTGQCGIFYSNCGNPAVCYNACTCVPIYQTCTPGGTECCEFDTSSSDGCQVRGDCPSGGYCC